METEDEAERLAELRRVAERRVAHGNGQAVSETDAYALLHELQVHQIELQMQNEELQRAKAEAEDAARKYSDLYEFAPVGYLTVDENGQVLEANLTAGKLLGVEKSILVKAPFRYFVAPKSYADFDNCCRSVIGTGVKRPCELMLLMGGKEPFYALVEVTTIGEEDRACRHCQVTITDITELKHEQHIARALQDALIPAPAYDIEGLDVAVRYVPALKEAEVGGDFYDVFMLDDGKVGIMIGDVVGKGLQAAVTVAAARHSIRSYAYMDPRPSRVMTLANDALCRATSDEDAGALTAFFAIIDMRFRGITYANGGHEPPVVRTADGRVERLEVKGRAMGFMGGFEYPEGSRKLQPEDVVVMVTDGITEARPDSQSLFGIEGVEQYLSQEREVSPDVLAEGVLQAARAHAGGALRDDAAIVVLSLK